MLISHELGLSPAGDHHHHQVPFTPRQPFHAVRAPYICVLISTYCGILGRGDLAQVTLYLDIWVGAFDSLHVFEGCQVVITTPPSEPPSCPVACRGSVRRNPDG